LVAELLQRQADTCQRLASATQEKVALEQQRDGLQLKVSKLEREPENIRLAFEARIKDLEHQLAAAPDMSKEEVAEVQKQLEESKGELASATAKASELSQQREELQLQASQQQEKNEAHIKVLEDQLAAAPDEAKEQVVEVQKQLEECKGELASATAKVSELSQQREELQLQASQQQEKNEARIKDLEDELSAAPEKANLQLLVVLKELEDCKSELASATQKLSEVSRQREELELRASQQEKNEARSRGLEDQLASTQDVPKEEDVEVHKQLEECRRELASANAKVSELLQQQEDLKLHISQLEKKKGKAVVPEDVKQMRRQLELARAREMQWRDIASQSWWQRVTRSGMCASRGMENPQPPERKSKVELFSVEDSTGGAT